MNNSQILGSFLGFLVASIPIIVGLWKIITDVRQVKVDINGRVTQLLKVNSAASHAAGMLEGGDKVRSVLSENAQNTITTASEQALALIAEAEANAIAILAEAEAKARVILAEAQATAANKAAEDKPYE